MDTAFPFLELHFTTGFLDRMQTRAELYDLIGYHDHEALDGAIARSALPDTPGEGGGSA